MTAAAPSSRVFRLSALAYLVVLFLLFGTIPIAFTTTGEYATAGQVSVRTLALIIPLLAALFVARTATIVDAGGITVRAVFGSRRLGWDELRGLSVTGTSVYAVVPEGSVRLPCVRINDLAELSRLSEGRLPDLPAPRPKFAPSRRRRR